MEQLFALEIWVALTGASCITGWLIGDWNGSERMRRLIGDHDQLEHDGWEPLKRAPKLASARSSQERVRATKAAMATHGEQRPAGEIKTEHSTRRIDAMPALAELHAEAEAIRRSGRVWDSLETGIDYEQIDPNSAKVLTRYKSSIEKLHNLKNAVRDDQFELELPRFSDAAPVSPFFKKAEHAQKCSPQRAAASRLPRGKALAPAD